MTITGRFRRLLARLLGPPHLEPAAAVMTAPAHETANTVAPRRPLDAWKMSDDASLGAITESELAAWENRDVPSIGRTSDAVETLEDEKQDIATTINFPLHWTSATLSWNYLFDVAVACQLLAPRPDDVVLDFAAGTCWASELLTRLGVRTVSIDLSTEMMRRGRLRFASDNRLIFRHQAGFVTARGQSLPFASESFDGVLCMNALHHLPSYAAALREIHRVLKPGGRAVFSEPGVEHAVQPLSRFRMREEGILEKNVSLPVMRRLAADAGFTRMRVIPLRSSANYIFDYTATAADGASLEQLWDDTLRHAPREHARFALHKGDDPPADSLLPADRLAGRLSARIVPERLSPTVRAGRTFHGSTPHREHRNRRVASQGTAIRGPGDVRAEDLWPWRRGATRGSRPHAVATRPRAGQGKSSSTSSLPPSFPSAATTCGTTWSSKASRGSSSRVPVASERLWKWWLN